MGLTEKFPFKKMVMKAMVYLLFVLGLSTQSSAQMNLEQAKKLQDERKHEEALSAYKTLYAKDSLNVEIICGMSLSYSRAGALMSVGETQKKYYSEAKRLGKLAIKLNKNYADSHLAYAVALARENENASTKTKISNAKEIKTECDQVFKIDPNNATAFHIMGRWHRTFAGLNGFERTMINTLYGGTPKGGTYADALDMFSKAIKLEPKLSMHVYELALTYYEMGQKANAKKFADKVMEYPVKSKDDEKTRKECEKLLQKLK